MKYWLGPWACLAVLVIFGTFIGCGVLIQQLPPYFRPSTAEPPKAAADAAVPTEPVEGPILDIFEQRFDKRFDERISRLMDERSGAASIFVRKLLAFISDVVKASIKAFVIATALELFWEHPYAISGIFFLAVNVAVLPLHLLILFLRRK